jgi:hypothetical protein
MILMLAVLIPIMLVTINLDLRSPAGQALVRFSLARNVETSLAGPGAAVASPAQKTEVNSEALSQEAAAAQSILRPEIAALGTEESEANAVRSLSLMALDFSLTDLSNARARLPDPDGPLKVTKAVYAGGQLIGEMEITVAGEGQLMLDASEVRAIIGQQRIVKSNSSARLPEQGPVSFATLREIGIDLRYSPNEDVIRINP